MQLGDLTDAELLRTLKHGIHFGTGPFVIRLRSSIPALCRVLAAAYPTLHLLPDNTIAHYRIEVQRKRGPRGWLAPQAVFYLEGIPPFDPYPLSQAFPMFEWGLNWSVATTAHQYLLLHSAAVEMNGDAVLMPAQPGSGKSTLCAAMVTRGWRLLSDEFGVVDPDGGLLLPFPRAAPLKNASIEVIRRFAPQQRMGPLFEKTRKGTVSHLYPPSESIARQHEPARPRLVLFPRFQEGAGTRFIEQPPEHALTRLVNNSFNYLVTGERGFNALCDLLQGVRCFQLVYGDLEDAINAIGVKLRNVTAAMTEDDSAISS